jgi:bifunctional non-homologous end joining protein LigD
LKVYDLNEYREKKVSRVLTNLEIFKKGLTLSALKGKKIPWPDSFTPQLATLVSRIPEGEEWLNEIKFDGYRMIAKIKKGRVHLITRGGQNWTYKYESIARELSRLPIENGIIDGEMVIQNADGTTNFQRLQNYRKGDPLLFYVFDLPYLNGQDLSELPLIERKSVLKELIKSHGDLIPSVQYSTHMIGNGGLLFQAACQHRAEGIISKRSDSKYVQGRSKSWVKVKCIKRQEFIVIGYTEGKRSFFGSLLLGYYDGRDHLIYCGNVGTGFNSRNIGKIHESLNRLEDFSFDHPSIKDPLRRKIHWVNPAMVVEVKYSEITDRGIIRHASFIGIRGDRDPKDVTLET